MASDYHEIEYWLENNRVRNNDIEPKKISMFRNLYNSCLRVSYTIYRDVLESRQVERMFELMNPKHKD